VNFFLSQQVIGILNFGCIAASLALRESYGGHGGQPRRYLQLKAKVALKAFDNPDA
jgi:hypothetical protein